MNVKVFVSYRRKDAKLEANLIANALRLELGADTIFIDGDIKPGSQWPDTIRTALNTSLFVLVIIGPDWFLAGDDKYGQRRIDEIDDWVRQEIALALSSGKTVIPILVREASLPPPNKLPNDLAQLSSRQCLKLRSDNLEQDLTQIVHHLRQSILQISSKCDRSANQSVEITSNQEEKINELNNAQIDQALPGMEPAVSSLSFDDYSKIFTPSSPVELAEFFVGRSDELFTVIKTIERPGQHALIFGERGIGKTCLTEVALRERKERVVKLQCGNKWTFKQFSNQFFNSIKRSVEGRLQDSIVNTEVEWDASSLIYELRNKCKPTIIVLDEYDLLPKNIDFHKQISMFLKGVSNQPSELPFTFIIVGIAKTANELLDGHKSSGRNLQEIYLKFIERRAIREFLERSEKALKIRFDKAVIDQLVEGSFGYPYFVHLICESIFHAIERKDPLRRYIDKKFYKEGLTRAVNSKYQDLKDRYEKKVNQVSANARECLKWICLYHDRGIRETEKARMKIVGNGILEQSAYDSAIENINNRDIPIEFKTKFINVSDPLFLPFLIKYFWGSDPPDIDSISQRRLF